MGQGKDKEPRRWRQQTPAEKAATIAKKAATQHRTEASARGAFVSGMRGESSGPGLPGGPSALESEPSSEPEDAARSDGHAPEAEQAAHASPGGGRSTGRIDGNVRCEDVGEEEDALDKVEPESSVMKVYARSILERLREELSGKCTTKLWLLETLKASSWWLRAKCARDVMAQLQPASDPSAWPNPFYLRDIFIWLPEERWGEQPCCPTCDSNSDIHPHDYQLAWPTRRCFEHALNREHAARLAA